MSYINPIKSEIYHDEKDSRYHIDSCFFVDEMMALPILELNRKGWITEYCCSGHLTNAEYSGKNSASKYSTYRSDHNFAYIVFNRMYEFSTLPDGWKLDQAYIDQYKKMAIEIRFTSEPFTLNRLTEILEAVKSLYLWSVNL